MKIRLIPDNTKFKFMQRKKISFSISFILAIVSIILVSVKGLNFGIDFRGGTLIELSILGKPSTSNLRADLSKLELGEVNIQEIGSLGSDFLIRIEKQIGENKGQKLLIEKVKDTLQDIYGKDIDYRRVEFVGPTVSKDLIYDGALAIILAIIAMLIYIWFRFELPFALGAVVALVHDIILTVGMFSITGLEFNLSTVAAILLIIGYSMNDTVVVFDRVRENLKKYKKLIVEELLNKSLNETLARTVNTTVTTIFALLALYIFGGNIIKDFSFAMIWGILVGTYSSLFIASPVLSMLNIRFKEKVISKSDGS